MNCPKCNKHIECGCKHCRKRNGDKQDMMVKVDTDIEACPYCRFTAHLDQWLDIQGEQILKAKQ